MSCRLDSEEDRRSITVPKGMLTDMEAGSEGFPDGPRNADRHRRGAL